MRISRNHNYALEKCFHLITDFVLGCPLSMQKILKVPFYISKKSKNKVNEKAADNKLRQPNRF